MADLATHSRRDHSDVLVLIPAFNEEGCVGQVVKDVVQLGYAALVIDDGSVDRTAEKAEREGAIVLRLPDNPVAIGDTWDEPFEVKVNLPKGASKSIKTRWHHKLADVKDGGAEFDLIPPEVA